MGLIIRALARLLALGALAGSWILLLICCLSVPTRNFNFSQTTLGTGQTLELGMWGWCLKNANGTGSVCSPTSVGYHLNVTTLSHYSANPGGMVNITEKPLTSALIFYPLAVGSTSLANLLTLVPVRIVTMMALGLTFLSIGATVIAFAIALVTFTRANSLLQISFNPNTYAKPMLGNCLWFTAAALLCITGSFLFLLVALEPKKSSGQKDESVLTTAVYGANYDGATESKWARELEREKSRSGRSRAAVAGREDRRIDAERRSIDSRRSGGYAYYDDGRSRRSSSRRSAGGRRYRDEEEYSYSDEEEEVRRPPRAARRNSQSSRRKRVSKYEQDDEDETETEEEPSRRKKSSASNSGSRRSARRAEEEEEDRDGYVDFAGRRF